MNISQEKKLLKLFHISKMIREKEEREAQKMYEWCVENDCLGDD